jgi:hypothetical protein
MTQPTAREAVYSELMWPEWNPQTEARGTSYEHAQQLLNNYRAAVLDEAIKAVLGRVTAYEGMGQESVALNRERSAIAELLRRMAVEETSR